jgi:aminoglycoside phosphotransferase (APT) family kinase protein
MSTERIFPARGDLAAVVTAGLGRGRRLDRVQRLRGGSKKGVYRLGLSTGDTVIAYIWGDTENYWPARPDGSGGGPGDPFTDASGSELFETASTLLGGLGIRTPQVYALDRSRAVHPSDFALVEDVAGDTLEARLDRAEPAAAQATARLGEALRVMHGHRGASFGRPGLPADGDSCEQIVLDRALRDLGEAAAREPRIAAASEPLEARLRELAAGLVPRREFALIHGELGPDHVLVDPAGKPVIIDIEGLMYFDLEWEHVFLRLRFGTDYRWLAADGLEQRRLASYELALYLSLVAGPLRLLDGDFPDRAPMLAIAEYNIGHALACLD